MPRLSHRSNFAAPTLGIGGSIPSQGTASNTRAGRTFNFGYTAITTVEALENISVSAGTFDTIRVRMDTHPYLRVRILHHYLRTKISQRVLA